ncbi:glycine cleavage system protein H [Rhodococcoides fascians A25f]|uniref:glycine cleavage system protein H n=1 Tax=Rhodococcoides fascians TaxID=1828 RepID=UPI000691C468|nr:glycine cleavage system protein H [Rhodococcus fascians]QII04417.1 glycine cleavage system protein H [Rhodococcus fascians A25f]
MTAALSSARRLFSTEHGWMAVDPFGSPAQTPSRVGVTPTALGGAADILDVDLPTVRTVLTAGEACGTIRTSTGSVTVFAPASGMVTIVNPVVLEDPSIVAADPLGAGWLFAVLTPAASSFDDLTTREPTDAARVGS